MAQLTLTRHFVKRWMERVGTWPTVEAVGHFIASSVKVQHGENLIRASGRPFRMLSIYWHPELSLVIKVDTERQVAVTVLSKENWQKQTLDTAVYFKEARAPRRATIAERIARIKAVFGIKAAKKVRIC